MSILRITKRSWIMPVLAFVSVVYLAGLAWLFFSTQMCSTQPGAGFVAKWLACRASNEIGDFLAGAFAPLAFLWLVGAVLIQSRELSAQREEMKGTQKVLKEQTQILRDQHRTQEFEAKYQTFKETFYELYIQTSFGEFRPEKDIDFKQSVFNFASHLLSIDFSDHKEEAVIHIHALSSFKLAYDDMKNYCTGDLPSEVKSKATKENLKMTLDNTETIIDIFNDVLPVKVTKDPQSDPDL